MKLVTLCAKSYCDGSLKPRAAIHFLVLLISVWRWLRQRVEPPSADSDTYRWGAELVSGRWRHRSLVGRQAAGPGPFLTNLVDPLVGHCRTGENNSQTLNTAASLCGQQLI